MNKFKRLFFIISFLSLVLLEFFIGIYVKDDFIRPYFGDFIVVVVLYLFVRSIFPSTKQYISIYVFVFSIIVEISQLIPLVNLLHIENHFVRILMGTSFSIKDIWAYTAGSLLNLLFDIIVRKSEI